MGRKIVREERRIRILEAVDECLLKKSFNQTSIKDIAQEAGVNHGMLHYYFENKEDLLLNYIDFVIAKLSTVWDNWIRENISVLAGSPEEYQKTLRAMFDQITLNRNISRIFIELWSIANYNEQVRLKLQNSYLTWQSKLLSRIDVLVPDKAKVNDISMALIAFFEGNALLSILLNREHFNVERVLDGFSSQAYHIVKLFS
ncbi:MAG: TetR/AcrR family transcriptional regulator [Proteobacteria bacterium]|nr:TetR/AcrR family transcriptional regulator [Pseudomonadota bacterium]